jgi:hypothetical protein
MVLRLNSLADLHSGSPSKPRKYRNNPTVLDGVKFDSKAEARRYAELQLLLRAGQIRNLRRQVRFELLPSVRLHGAQRATPALTYVCDFAYEEGGREVIEDVKGAVTKEYRIKRHLMKALLGLDIRELRV